MKKINQFIFALFSSAGIGLLVTTCLFLASCSNQSAPLANEKRISFDDNWRFLKDSLQGAEVPDFNDSNWRLLDVPHDWSIEDLPGQNSETILGPFDKSAIDRSSSGYTVMGTAWYRKTFTLKEEDKNKFTYIEFDGVYNNSDVWINGNHLGFHPYGYTPFYYDLTPYLNPAGKPNVIAVKVNNTGNNSRWYSGSGITRHVWLTVLDPVHIAVSGGIYVTTPSVSTSSADVRVVTTLVNSGSNDQSVILKTDLLNPSGKAVETASSNVNVTAGQTLIVSQMMQVKNPSLWSLETPTLYSAKTTVSKGESIFQEHATPFGIRSIKIDAKEGLLINGKSVDIIGGCYHHDNGPLGAASIDRAEERRIEVLKKYGFNGIRTSHNPPSPALLDACDRLGMLVLDEIFDMWESPKKKLDYSLSFKEWWQKDVQSWIERDRNHPSVIFWSIGNEIREASDTSGLRIANNLVKEVRKFDPTRAVTEALVAFGGGGFGGQQGRNVWEEMAPHMALLDVVGYNYAWRRYEEDHVKYPDRIMMGTETNPPLALENYRAVKKLPYVIGYFVWTAIDNIGEAGMGMPTLRDANAANQNPFGFPGGGPGGAGPQGQPQGNMPGQGAGAQGANRPRQGGGQQGAGVPGAPGAMPGMPGAGGPGGPGGGGGFRREAWPVYTNYQGDIDIIGNRKVPSYYQYVVWGLSKVEMFVHRPIPEGMTERTSQWGFPDELKSWNWEGREGKKFQVHVYTGCTHVKLELNGKVVGEQDVDQEKSITATFEVPYEAGKLVAHCYDNGKEVASQTLATTGKPASIRLIADRTKIKADRNDLSYVRAEVLDSKGNVVPDADEVMVNFEVTGVGKVAGVGSGNPRDMSSFQQPRKKAYEGICLAVIQPERTPGKITVKATAEGLKGASVDITAR